MKKDRLLTVNKWNRKSMTSPRNIFDYGGYAAFAQQGANSIPSESTTFGKWEYDNGAFDAADPLFYMTEGRHSKVGDTFDKMAVSAVQTGNPWAALAGAGMKIVGDFINAGWGMKEDTASIDTMNREKAFYKNFESNAKNFDDLVTIPAPYRKAKVYEGGWFTEDDAESKNAAFIKDFDNAYNYALRSVDNNAENIKKDQMSRALANYSAYGGPIGQYGTDDLGAVGYNFMSDYLTMKNNKVNSDSKMTNVFQGYPSTMFAFGGDVQTNGSDFSTGATHINAGKSHEENPYDGVQVGVDNEGVPNLVEEGEVIYNDYVFSARIPVDDETKKKFKLSKKRDISYADLAKKLETEIAERPNDPISKASFKAQMQQLEEQQERQKQEMEAERAEAAFNALSPEEKVAVINNAAQQQALQQQALQQAASQPSPEEIAMAQQEAMMQQGPEQQMPEVNAMGGDLDEKENVYAKGGPKKGSRKAKKMAKVYDKEYLLDWAKSLGIIDENAKELPFTFDEEDPMGNLNNLRESYRTYKEKADKEKYIADKRAAKQMELFGTKGNYRMSDDGKKIYKKRFRQEGEDFVDAVGNTLSADDYNTLSEEDQKKYSPITRQVGDLLLNSRGLAVEDLYDGNLDELLDSYNQNGEYADGFKFDSKSLKNLQYPSTSSEPGDYSGWHDAQRTLGALGPAAGLGMMAAEVGKPNYSDMQVALDVANRAPSLGSYTPLGDYLTYRPMDIWAEQNRLNANARATDRAITNNGAPVGTKMAGLLANAYNNQIALGNLYRNALEYNDAQREKVATFNRGTNQYNSEAGKQTSLANAQMMNADKQYRANMAMQYAKDKMDAEAGWYNSLYGNVDELFKGIGDLGTEGYRMDRIREMARDGLFEDLSNSYLGRGLGYRKERGPVSKKRKRRLRI